jgi:hypothetical protein
MHFGTKSYLKSTHNYTARHIKETRFLLQSVKLVQIRKNLAKD